jgi:hypothetical protein
MAFEKLSSAFPLRVCWLKNLGERKFLLGMTPPFAQQKVIGLLMDKDDTLHYFAKSILSPVMIDSRDSQIWAQLRAQWLFSSGNLKRS